MAVIWRHCAMMRTVTMPDAVSPSNGTRLPSMSVPCPVAVQDVVVSGVKVQLYSVDSPGFSVVFPPVHVAHGEPVTVMLLIGDPLVLVSVTVTVTGVPGKTVGD